MTIDEQRAIGRLEGKVDTLADSLDALHIKLDQVVTREDCAEHRGRDDARHSKSSDRMTLLEDKVAAAGEQRAGWLGSWRAVAAGAGAVLALAGLLAAMGVLQLR